MINPLYQPELAPALAAIEAVATVMAVPMFALAVASLVLRYRRSDDIGRHQIRWLAAAAGVAAVAFACSFFSPPDLRAIFEGVGILGPMPSPWPSASRSCATGCTRSTG